MSGYNWQAGMSNNAVAAYHERKMPISKAVPVVAAEAGVSRAVARAALVEVGPCEWHHASKFYNRVDFYDIAAALDRLRFDADPLGDHVETAEHAESLDATTTGCTYDYSLPNWCMEFSVAELLRLGFLQDRLASVRADYAARIERAANFRRWEPALRRLAGGAQ